MKTIFDVVELDNIRLKNRLIRSATWEGLGNKDGSPPQEQLEIYEKLAAGGVGGIITGYTSVSSIDNYFEGMMRLSKDSVIPSFKELSKRVKKYQCAILSQLALGEFTKKDNSGINRSVSIDDLTVEDIEEIVVLFAQAARRAQEAGFDGVQIHAAHGFFLSRFISPEYNHRTGNYGGTVKKRARILIDILNAIKKTTNGMHVSMKINCSDFLPNGLTLDESSLICEECAANGLNSLEISGNGTSRIGIRSQVNEAYFFDFAYTLKKNVDIPIILVGGHRSIENMNHILTTSAIECLSLSRPLIREPQLPNRWKNCDKSPSKCISCNACYRTHAHHCIYNQY